MTVCASPRNVSDGAKPYGPRPSRTAGFAAFAMLVGLVAAAPAPADTLARCLGTGVARSRTARQLAAELGRQRATLGAARADFSPKVTVTRDTTDRSVVQVNDKLATQTAVNATVTEDSTGGRSEILSLSQGLFVHSAVELVRARLGWEIARVVYEQGLEDYKFAVIQRFFAALRSRERVRTLEESVERWSRALAFAEVKFKLGASSKIDVLNTRVNRGNAETALLNEQQSLASAMDELRDLMGVEMTRPLTLEEPIDFSHVSTAPARRERREVRAARLRVDVARANLRDAEQRSKPDIRLDTSYRSFRNSAFVLNNQLVSPSDSEVVGAVTYNFQFGKRGADYDLERLRHDLESARIGLEQQLVTVEREKRDILRALELKERGITTAKESLDLARESYDFSLDAFQKGILSSLDLRDSQDKLTQAREVYTSLLIDYKVAGHQYVKVLGGTLGEEASSK
ncbi:MAG: TolC family protein [Candidatus Wallbacteria bacterium]|nr:TolC family protein [Candidatus Wallbacteria bacterium]